MKSEFALENPHGRNLDLSLRCFPKCVNTEAASRTITTTKKIVKPEKMSQIAFDSLFGDRGIITNFRDGVIDGKYIGNTDTPLGIPCGRLNGLFGSGIL